MAKEIEILVEVFDEIQAVLPLLDCFESKGIKKTKDIYYFDPLRDDLKPDDNHKIHQCFRLRSKAGEYSLTYKVDQYDGDVWQYSDEHEIKVSSFEECQKIITSLGLQELVTINNAKHTYINQNYEIVLEEVEGLGLFLEVEFISVDDDADVSEMKHQIRDFITSLGIQIGDELNAGKPELMLLKKSGMTG